MTHLVPLKEAGARLFPSPAPSIKTLRRWVKTGHKGAILRTRRIGFRIYTTQADVDAFEQAVSAQYEAERHAALAAAHAPHRTENGDTRRRLKAKHGL